jgi:hypothetical protein
MIQQQRPHASQPTPASPFAPLSQLHDFLHVLSGMADRSAASAKGTYYKSAPGFKFPNVSGKFFINCHLFFSVIKFIYS